MNDTEKGQMVKEILKNIGATDFSRQAHVNKVAALLQQAGIDESRVAMGNGSFNHRLMGRFEDDELIKLRELSQGNAN